MDLICGEARGHSELARQIYSRLQKNQVHTSDFL
jgi:hypothetical protein